MLTIRQAMLTDAAAISRLIGSLSQPFLLSPDGSGADSFFESVSEAAICRYIEADNFVYYVGEMDAQLAGIVAMRDNRHLYHLFVTSANQGSGIGRALWQYVRDAALAHGNPGEFTVNSSLNAIPVYRAFGFVEDGAVVQAHGVAFQPMRARLDGARRD